MSAIDTNLPISQLNPAGMGAQQGTKGPYDAYVGPSMTPGRTSAYQKRKFHTQNLPDAFVDRALRIRDTTEDIAWLSQQKWQTSTVLPLRIVEDLVLHVEHFEAWPTFFSVTPEQAVAHMVTQSSTVHEVRLVRWSLQARLEHGFMGTPIGQERYNAMLNQFATSMNETANAEVARALLDATDPQQTWLQRHGQLHMEDLMNYLRWDLFIFGALQKNPNNPLEVINQRVNSMMKAYGGRADTIIMSEDLEMYAQLVPANKTEYWLGGQEAVNRVNGKGPGVDRNTGGIFNSIDPVRYLGENAIYIHRSMVVENQGDVDPWHRTRQYGTWNIMEDTVRDHENYTTDRRTIFVYNQDTDTMSPLRLRDAIENCMMFDRNGFLRKLGADGNVDPRYNRDARFFPFAVEANSYDPIKYCGDLSQVHFDLGDVNKLAISMINSAYRDAPQAKSTDAFQIGQILNEAQRRLRSNGLVRFQDLFYTVVPARDGTVNQVAVQEYGGVRTPGAVWNNFANRMAAIMPNSIFLDGANSVYTNPGTAASTLWETLVLSGAVPIYADVGQGQVRDDAYLQVLLDTFRTVLAEESAGARDELDDPAGSPEERIQRVVGYLREHPDETTLSRADLNAWITEQLRMYREGAAGERTQGIRVTAGQEIAGWLVPGATLPQGRVFGMGGTPAAVQPQGRGDLLGLFRERERERAPATEQRSGGAAPPIFVPEGEEGFPNPPAETSRSAATSETAQTSDLSAMRGGQYGDLSSAPELRTPATTSIPGMTFTQALMPRSVEQLHMFSRVINASMSGSSSRGVRRAARASLEGRLGSMTEQIGASVMEDEELFQTRFRERGHFSRAARRLGLRPGLSPAAIAASLQTLSSNLEALADRGMPLFRKVMAIIYYGLPFTRQTLLSMCDNNIVVPVTFLFVRPHVTVETRIMVKCLSGGGSGYTYYAHANVAVGDNVLTKTHTINMHFYLRSHVHAPRNVFIIPDVFVMGYHGGLGVTPVTEPSQYQPNAQAPGAPCALYFMCSYKTTRETVPNPFDISGHFNSRYRVRGAPSVSRPAFDTVAFYGPYLGLGGISGNADMPVLYEQHRNTLVYRGHQEEDDGRGGYTKIEPNTGHWGHRVYKGCKPVREGEYYRLQDVAYGRGVYRTA